MTWVANKLREQVQIRKPTRERTDDGGTERGYTTLLTVWGAYKPVRFGSFGQTEYIRGEQERHTVTHDFLFRRIAFSTLYTAYSSGYSAGYDTIPDLNVLKSDHYLFVQRGSSVKGRMFRIRRIVDNDERRELIKIGAEEVEELGTGYPT